MAKPAPGTTLRPSAATVGLVGAYVLNEGAGGGGTQILDYSGLNHHGILEYDGGTPPATFWANANPDHDPALIVDKTPVKMWLRIPHHTDLNFSSSFTIAIGYAVPAIADNAQFDVMMGKASTDSWDDGLTIWTQQPAGVNWGFVTTEYVVDEMTDVHPTPYNDTSFHHAVFLYDDPANETRLHVDCTLRATTALTQPRVNNSSDLYIGRQPSATQRNFSAYVFYVYIWNRLLPSDELAALCVDPYYFFAGPEVTLPAAMETTMRNARALVHPVLELTLGGELYKFAEYPVTSESVGAYLPYVESFGDTTRRANIYENTLEVPEFDVTVYDQDRVLQKLLGGPLRGAIRESHAETWWRSFVVPVEDHYRDFSGVVHSYASPGDRKYRFRLRPDMTTLETTPQIPYFSIEHFPEAPERSHGQPLWSVYGRQISSGVSDSAGMIECLPAKVESGGGVLLWAANYGALANVSRVMFDDEDRTNAFTNFTLQRGSALYHMVNYTGSAPFPTDKSKIQIDAEGLMDAPAAGSVMTNPAVQLRHFLKTFVYGTGDVRAAAAWGPETGKPLSTTVFDICEQFFRIRNVEGAMVVYANKKSIDVLNDWCKTWKAAPFFTDSFELAVLLRDQAVTDIFLDDRHVAQKLQHALGPLSFDTRRNKPVSDLVVNHLFDQARGGYAKSTRVSYRRTGFPIVEETLDQLYGKRTVF